MKLYTAPECNFCITAKQIIKDKNLDVEIIHIDMDTREGRDIAMNNRIMWAPVLDADKRYIGWDVITYLTSL